MPSSHLVEFSPFRLDLKDERLWRGHDEVLALTPKVFTVLRCLVEQAGQLVTKDTLLSMVWPETAIGESNLTGCIWELRRALGDSARTPQYIETVHGRGYRFIAPLTETSSSKADVCSRDDPPQVPPVRPNYPEVFVGRQSELDQLQQWYETARRGQRQVGLIAGEPGIGKTALVDTFVSRLMTVKDVWVAHGQCIEQYGSGEPYLPLLEALGRLCRGDDGQVFLSHLRQHASSWLRQMPSLLTTQEREASELQDRRVTRQRMLRELAEAIELLTADHPLILVLEDLHWSDESTLEWLSYVARRRDPACLLILMTYRLVDAIVNKHPVRTVTAELKQRPNCAELALDYLSEHDVAVYLAQRCGGKSAPLGLAHALHQRTNGNPLFMNAVVDELIRQRVLIEGSEAWEVWGGVSALDGWVPETLRTLIELQLEQLDTHDQILLEAASVAGVEFTVAALAAGVEDTEGEVETRCAALAYRGQFLQVREPAQWPDGTVTARYGFLHAFYQEVLYRGLPLGRQSSYHARIGTRLARGFGQETDDIAAELAMHFVHGHQPTQAAQYSCQAGLNAERRGAYHEAIQHLTSGIDRLAMLPATSDRDRRELALLISLARPLHFVKGYASVEVSRILTRASDLCQQVGDNQQLRHVLFGLWNSSLLRGELQTAYELAKQLHTLDPFGDSRHLGYTLFYRGDLTSAWERIKMSLTYQDSQHVLSQATDIPSKETLIRVSQVLLHSYASFNLWLLGYPDQAVRQTREALELAEAWPHPHPSSAALSRAVILHQLCHREQVVHELAEAAITASRELGDNPRHAQGTMIRGWALAAEGQADSGLRLMRQGLDALQSTGAMLYVPYFVSLLADGYGIIGYPEQGLEILDEACSIIDSSDLRWVAAHVYRTKGELLLLLSHKPEFIVEAETCFQLAIDIARQQQAKSWELRAATSLARLWQEQDKCQEAYDLLAPVYGWFTEGFDTADLKDAKVLLQELSEGQP